MMSSAGGAAGCAGACWAICACCCCCSYCCCSYWPCAFSCCRRCTFPDTAVAVPATTAVRAAIPISPGRPIRLIGMVSSSTLRDLFCFVLVRFRSHRVHDRRGDALAVHDDAARLEEPARQRLRPQVLDHEDSAGRSGFDRLGDLLHILVAGDAAGFQADVGDPDVVADLLQLDDVDAPVVMAF